MRTITQVPVLVILLLLFANCDKDNIASEINKQKVLFQYEYMNYAWGYQHSGWLLDSLGNMHCYRSPQKWNFCDSLGYISELDMEANMLQTDSICNHVDMSELKSKIELIESASKGEITKPVHEMCDAGSRTYAVYIYDSEKQSYKMIILKQLGDFRVDNKSEAAENLFHWLESIGRK